MISRRGLFRTAGAVAAGALVTQGMAGVRTGGEPSGDFIEVEGQRLHYRVLGETGPEVVVIHGASGNLLDWAEGLAPKMAETNRVLVLDRPGMGFSTRSEGGESPFVQARLLRAAAAQLGFGGAILVGHSYGGAVALAWALDAPETLASLLLLAAPSHVWEAPPSLRNRILVNPLGGPVLAHLAAAFVPDGVIESGVTNVFAPQAPPDAYAERINARRLLRPEILRNNAADLVALKGHIRQMQPRYGELAMPVELLHGDADTTVWLDIHSRPFAETVENARLTVLDGIGHMPHHVAKGEVLAALGRLNATYPR